MTKKTVKPLTGRQVISWFVAFFVVVITVNGIMSYFAISTFSGIETEDAYRKGRDFNDEIARAKAQNEILWQVAVTTQSRKDADVINLSFNDGTGMPLAGMDVSGLLFRPVHKGIDQPLRFVDMGGGQYTVVVKAPRRGKWQLQVKALRSDKQPFLFTHDLFLNPQS